MLQSILNVALSLQSAIDELKGGGGSKSVPAGLNSELEHAPRARGEPLLTDQQRRICEQVINVFETGTIAGKYGAISIYNDGPNGIRQITYGRSQTTEYGNLRELIEIYASADGQYSDQLRPYVPKIGSTALVDNQAFKNLLKSAGNEDQVMHDCQDVFFDRRYFQPALRWAGDNGFSLPLSVLVIYDSFIHSGGILGFLRERFSERPPARGGREESWISKYVQVRHDWLSSHSNAAVRASSYRTRDLLREIANGNWDLSDLPFKANGTLVYGHSAEREAPPAGDILHIVSGGGDYGDAA
ncbi:chitosanase (plasmid) [Rhizobium leguminosarum bv. viciae]|nr:chitosanase [Rhizobium leguminosarum bv. viciae]